MALRRIAVHYDVISPYSWVGFEQMLRHERLWNDQVYSINQGSAPGRAEWPGDFAGRFFFSPAHQKIYVYKLTYFSGKSLSQFSTIKLSISNIKL